MRAFYEDAWAAAPADPEPWAWAWRRGLLLAEARPGERVLDLGCGAGRFVAALRGAGADPVGVEVAEAALERARAVAPGADLRLAPPDGPTCRWPTARSTSCGARRCSSMSPTPPGCCRRSAACCARAGGCSSPRRPTGRLRAAAIALARFERHFDPLGGHLRFYTRRSLATTLDTFAFDDVQVRTARRGSVLVGRAVRGSLHPAFAARDASRKSEVEAGSRGSR